MDTVLENTPGMQGAVGAYTDASSKAISESDKLSKFKFFSTARSGSDGQHGV